MTLVENSPKIAWLAIKSIRKSSDDNKVLARKYTIAQKTKSQKTKPK